MSDIQSKKIACIGCGVMGGALVKAMVKVVSASNITVTAVSYAEAVEFSKVTGVKAAYSNAEAVKDADFIFIAVKPAYVAQVLAEIRGEIKDGAVYVSMAAGVTLESIASFAENGREVRAIRIMPNIPATVGEAMIALAKSENTPNEDAEVVKSLLGKAGKVDFVAEKLMDGVTAVSGSGPAYAFLFIEALADAAVRFGIPRKSAYLYAAQTLKGAATLFLEDGRSRRHDDRGCDCAGERGISRRDYRSSDGGL